MTKSIYILNMIYSLLQIILLSILVYFLFGESLYAMSYVLGLSALAVGIVLFRHYKKDPFGKTTEFESTSEDFRYQELISKAEQLSNKKIPVRYIENKALIYPGFYHKGIVYINRGPVNTPDHFIEGLVAHELGHAISGFADKFMFASIRLSNIFRASITTIRYQIIIKRKKKLNKYIDGFIYYLVKAVSYLDEILLYRYIREEEHNANIIACKLTNGESLRTYYYNVHKRRLHSKYNFDVVHPTPQDMIKVMEKHMDIDQYNQDVYSIDNKIYYVDNCINKTDENIKRFQFYLNKANQEDHYVLNRISEAYYRGFGTLENLDKALQYALLAIEKGSEKAYFNAALVYEKKEEYMSALEYYQYALDHGVLSAKRKIDTILKKVEIIEHEDTGNIRIN